MTPGWRENGGTPPGAFFQGKNGNNRDNERAISTSFDLLNFLSVLDDRSS